MKVNYRIIYIAEKATDFGLNLIPDELLKKAKSLVTGKGRSKLLSNTKSFFDVRIKKAMNNFDMCRQVAELNPKGKVVLELGSGGHGVDLILLYLLGARKIFTVDIRFFGFLYMLQAIHDFKDHIDEIAKTFQIKKEEVQSRYDALTAKESVEDFMKAMNIHFLTFDALREEEGVIDEKVDFFFSESNLQRIPLKYINNTLRQVTDYLADGAITFHRVDTGDINTQPTRPLYDPKLYRFGFLKYSDSAWNLRITERIGSQNRLRQPEYIDMFSTLGFWMCYAENYLYRNDVEKMANFKKNERFIKFTDRENAIAHSRLIGIFGETDRELREKDFYDCTKGKKEILSHWESEVGLCRN